MTTLLAVSPTGLVSGAEVVLRRITKRAETLGWDVLWAAPPGEVSERAMVDGAVMVPLPELKLPAGPKAAAVTGLAWRTAAAARKLKEAAAAADVILANGLLALPALRLGQPRPPVAWLVHDVISRPSARRLLRASAGVVDLAVAVSHAAARPLVTAGVGRVEVVTNGTPWPVPPALAPDQPPWAPPVIGCASLLTPWKGHAVLLEAVARLSPRPVIVECLGGNFPKDARYADALRERAARPDLAGKVRFTGRLEDAVGRMRAWTVAVNASVDPEACPLAVLEAMSIGLPVVATGLGGTTEILGEAGLLVRPADPDALAAGIARLLDDRPLYRRCAAAGQLAVDRAYRLDDRLDDVLDHLSRLRAGHSAAGRRP